jgi:hypothetical protein
MEHLPLDDIDAEAIGEGETDSSSLYQPVSQSSLAADTSSTNMSTPDGTVHNAAHSKYLPEAELPPLDEGFRQSQTRTTAVPSVTSTTNPQSHLQSSLNSRISPITGNDADWELIVGHEDNAQPFLVSSMKIKSASEELWTALDEKLQGDAAVTRCSVLLPDEDVTSYEIVLNICHLRPDRCPRTIGFETLHHLADLADRYKLSVLLKASVRSWLLHLSDYQINLEDKRWLLTSWTFGLKAVFCTCLDQEIRRAQVDDDGQLIKSEAQPRLPSTCGVAIAGERIVRISDAKTLTI